MMQPGIEPRSPGPLVNSTYKANDLMKAKSSHSMRKCLTVSGVWHSMIVPFVWV